MVDKIHKALNKFSEKERKTIKHVLQQIMNDNLKSLDVKKLKGRTDIYRVRKRKVRILFYKKNDRIRILAVERRSKKTY